MFPKATLVFPTGKDATVDNARALILLCQDRNEQYVALWGARNDLQRLLVWGSRNWFILPPGENYFQAVTEILEAKVVHNDATPIMSVSPSCDLSGKDAKGMRCQVMLPGRTFSLAGIDDALLFALDEYGVMLRATGGSGIQKHFLLEAGIAALFGSDAAKRFAERTFSGAPTGTRRLVEGMRDQMRRQQN